MHRESLRSPHAIEQAVDSSRRVRDLVLTVTVMLVASSASWMRIPSDSRDVVWAEDGARFLGEYFSDGFVESLFTPYSGYLHVVPRVIVGGIASVFPMDHYGVLITAACCVVVGIVATLVFVCSQAVTTWLPARLALASLTVIVPSAPFEVLGNVANLHWYGLWLTPWLLIYRARTRSGSLILGGVALLCALTEIQCLVFLPLMLYRWRDTRMLPARVGLLAGCLAQVTAAVAAPRPSNGPLAPLDSTLLGYLAQPVASVFFPSGPDTGHAIVRFGWIVLVLLLCVFVAAFVYVVLRGSRQQRLLAASALAASFVVWCASFMININAARWFYAHFTPEQFESLSELRYEVAPSLLLLSLPVLCAAAIVGQGRAGYRRRAAAAAVLVACIGVCLVQFQPVKVLAVGPRWTPAVQDARAACLADPARGDATFAISPRGWTATIPCSELR